MLGENWGENSGKRGQRGCVIRKPYLQPYRISSFGYVSGRLRYEEEKATLQGLHHSRLADLEATNVLKSILGIPFLFDTLLGKPPPSLSFCQNATLSESLRLKLFFRSSEKRQNFALC